MSPNKILLTTSSLLISFTLAGFIAQIGLLVNPIAAEFDVEITAAASQFSWLLGGMLAGNLLSLAVLRKFKIKHVVIACYMLVLMAGVAMHTIPSFYAVSITLAVIGVAYGVGVCASSTVMTAIWDDKKRGAVFVSLDALFNAGGILFPFVGAMLFANNLRWSWAYLIVVLVTLLILFLAIVLNYGVDAQQNEQETNRTEWHIGLTLAGIGLFLVLISKLTPIIWLPTYIQGKFGVTPDVSAALISKIYLAGLIGSIASAVIVLKLDIWKFIAVAVVLGCISSTIFATSTDMGWITVAAYGFGLAVAAIFNSFTAWGVSYIESPNYTHVTFMYICGGAGGMVAPFLSGLVIDTFGISSVFIMGAVFYAAVFFMVIGLSFFGQNKAASTGAGAV